MPIHEDTEGLGLALARFEAESSQCRKLGNLPHRLGPFLAGFLAGYHGLDMPDPGPVNTSARVGLREGKAWRLTQLEREKSTAGDRYHGSSEWVRMSK